MATSMRSTRTNLLHMLKTAILRRHNWPKQKTNLPRLQRLTPRSTTLHPRSMPPSTTKLAIRLNIRQLHRNTRRSQRHHVGRPHSTTRSHTHHQRLTLLQLCQTHRQLRNRQSHRPQRPHIRTTTTSNRIPDKKQNRNDSAEQKTTPQKPHPHRLPNRTNNITHTTTLPNPQTKEKQTMNINEWLQTGINNKWIGPPTCATHDGIPSSNQETQQWDNGQDPCQHILRLYPDPQTADTINQNHHPHQWHPHTPPPKENT